MKKSMMMIAAILALVFSTSSCFVELGQHSDSHPTQVTQSGKKVVLAAFDEIEMSCPFDVNYEMGGSPSVVLEAPDDVLQYITIYVKENTLHIATNNTIINGGIDLDFSKVKLIVTSPTLKDIELAGSGNFNVNKPIDVNDDFDIEVAGSGKVDLGTLTCHDLDIQLAGSGNVNIKFANCNELETEVAGSGKVVCMNVKANNVETTVAGSGNVRFRGTAVTHKESVTGAGSIDVTELK